MSCFSLLIILMCNLTWSATAFTVEVTTGFVPSPASCSVSLKRRKPSLSDPGYCVAWKGGAGFDECTHSALLKADCPCNNNTNICLNDKYWHSKLLGKDVASKFYVLQPVTVWMLTRFVKEGNRFRSYFALWTPPSPSTYHWLRHSETQSVTADQNRWIAVYFGYLQIPVASV